MLTWIAIALATIVVVGGIGLVFQRTRLAAATPGAPVATASDDDYVVFLPLIEVESLTPKGKNWDTGSDAPDVRYEIFWRGSRIFQSSVRSDTLIARWDEGELGIRDLIQGISPERTLKAARITIKSGEKLEFRVEDDDTFDDDEIGRWEVAVESLRTGDQTWNAPAPGIRKVTCRVIRGDQKGR